MLVGSDFVQVERLRKLYTHEITFGFARIPPRTLSFMLKNLNCTQGRTRPNKLVIIHNLTLPIDDYRGFANLT